MAIPAMISATNEPILIELHDQPLAGEIADYINHLVQQNPHAPLTLAIRIHPLNIAEGLAHELAAHERGLLAGDEKTAAHEFADPHHPRETAAVRRQLADLMAEMVSPLEDATLAHHLLFVLTFGKNLPPPYAMNRLAICASFDSRHAAMHQRFATDRETAAPPGEAVIPAGMTLVCEPLETGYYRIPDDKRYRNASSLLMDDSIFTWSLQMLAQLALLQDVLQQAEASERDGLMLLDRKVKAFFLRFLLQRAAEAQAVPATAQNPSTTPVQSKIVFGRYAGNGGSVQTRNVEHRVASLIVARDRSASQHPMQHLLPQGIELQPE